MTMVLSVSGMSASAAGGAGIAVGAAAGTSGVTTDAANGAGASTGTVTGTVTGTAATAAVSANGWPACILSAAAISARPSAAEALVADKSSTHFSNIAWAASIKASRLASAGLTSCSQWFMVCSTLHAASPKRIRPTIRPLPFKVWNARRMTVRTSLLAGSFCANPCCVPMVCNTSTASSRKIESSSASTASSGGNAGPGTASRTTSDVATSPAATAIPAAAAVPAAPARGTCAGDMRSITCSRPASAFASRTWAIPAKICATFILSVGSSTRSASFLIASRLALSSAVSTSS